MDGLVKVGDSTVVVAFVSMGKPAAAVGPGVVGLELDGLVKVGDSLVIVAFVGVGEPAVMVGPG